MRIGYACRLIGVPKTALQSCTMKNAAASVLEERIAHNLDALETMIDYNICAGILLFRISSDLIPFGSSPVNSLCWQKIFAPRFSHIGQKIARSGMRISMHPGQYTVLNSPKEDVVSRAVEDLVYHDRVLTALNAGPENKLVLHVGGVYGDKVQAMERFCSNYGKLPEQVRRRLVIENDDRSYTAAEVLTLGRRLGVPVVYDNLHNVVNPCEPQKTDADWISDCAGTWKECDGPQKIHYAQQNPKKQPGAHSATICAAEFLNFAAALRGRPIDIMLEVKDKNLSAVKCMRCLDDCGSITGLEEEWARYQYNVLEGSPACYNAIRLLLERKQEYPAVEFYRLVEQALQAEITPGNAESAALHVWGYLKELAARTEKERFSVTLEAYRSGAVSFDRLKNYLSKLAKKYKVEYLLRSYYFVL